MKQLILLVLYFICCAQFSYGQAENLIPNEDFEFKIQPSFIDLDNPPIPCEWGAIKKNNDVICPNWFGFGFSELSNNSRNPDLFDSRYDCANISNHPRCYYMSCGYGGPERANVGIPNNFYGTQAHRTAIGGNTIGRYIGLKRNNIGNDPGVYIKLKRPLKCGYTYHLRFYAAKKDGPDLGKELEIRFCKGDSWVLDKVDLNGTNDHQIEVNVDNTDWELIDIPFYVSEPDVQYFMIRLKSLPNRKILLDDFSILDDCSVGKECSATYGDGIDNIYSNNVHTNTEPLTFYNLREATHVTISIFRLFNDNLVNVFQIENPKDVFSWNGRSLNGNTAPNGWYYYVINIGNDCKCRVIRQVFQKTGNSSIFQFTAGTASSTGIFTLYNLNNVHKLKLTISKTDHSIVRTIEIDNPRNTIGWSGLNDFGATLAVATYIYNVELTNNCGTEIYGGTFNYNVIDPIYYNNPELDYSPVPKGEFPCPYYADIREFPRPPLPCCTNQIDIFISNIVLRGNPEYHALHNINAGPNVIVETFSDVLFEAENEINLLPGFTVEPGAEFLARIAPCTRSFTPKLNIISSNSNMISNLTPFTKDTNLIHIGEVLPNPNNGEFKLKTNIEENSIFDIKLVDVSGKVLESYSSININEHVFNVKHFSPGIYFAALSQSDKYLVIKIIIE